MNLKIKGGRIVRNKQKYHALRSEVMNEVISYRPGFFARYSLLFISILLLSLVVIAWFIPYPESIRFSAQIINYNSIKIISEKENGFVPTDNAYYAEFSIPQKYYNKITKGLSVNLGIAAYPYNEFGFLKAAIYYISPVVSDSEFLAYVSLPPKAITNRNKMIQYKVGLKCEVGIIIKERNLLQRFYESITSHKEK